MRLHCTLFQVQWLYSGTMLQARRLRVWSSMGSLHFSIGLSFQPHYGPQVDSASNKNEYQEFPGGKRQSVHMTQTCTTIYEQNVQKMWAPMSCKPMGLHGLLQGYILIKRILQQVILPTSNVVQFYFKMFHVCMHLYTQWSDFVNIFSDEVLNLILGSSLCTENMFLIKNHKSCNNLLTKTKFGEVYASADGEVISLWKTLKLVSSCVRIEWHVAPCVFMLHPAWHADHILRNVMQTLSEGIRSVLKGTQWCQILLLSVNYYLIYN
jgi:hypothetical protein